jgi:iron complex outermembrane receptor protein
MPRSRVVAVAIVLLIQVVGGLRAQKPLRINGDTVVVLDSVVVHSTRPAVTAGGASALIARPEWLPLGRAPSLEAVLRQIPLVQVRHNGRGQAHLTIRGSSERQVAVLLDGIPLSIGWDHRADLSVLPAGAVTSISLVRGLSSMLAGPNVLGGVVELGVARGPFALEVTSPMQADASVDYFGAFWIATRAAHLIRGADGKLMLRAGAGWRSSPGIAASSEVPIEFRKGTLRANTDSREGDGFLSANYLHRSGAWLALSAVGTKGERGIAAETELIEPRWWRESNLSRFVSTLSGGTGARTTPLGVGSVEVGAGLVANNSTTDSYTSSDYRTVSDVEIEKTRTGTFRFLGDHSIGRRGDFRATFTWAEVGNDETTYSVPGEAPASPDAYRQRLWSVAGELGWQVPATLSGIRDVRLAMGIANDGADTPETSGRPPVRRQHSLGGRIGATGLLGDRSLLHFSISRRARFPSLRELYSGSLGRLEPNPALRPELLTGIEAGTTMRIGNGEVQTVGFYHHLSDAIVRVSTPERKIKRINRDAIKSIGVEILGSASIGSTLLSGDVTLQRVRAYGESGAPTVAEYQPAILGGLNVVVPSRSWRLTTGLDYVGPQECVNADQSTPLKLNSSAALDIRVGRSWLRGRDRRPKLETTLGLENVTNANAYDRCGITRAGRTLLLEFRLR